MTLVDLLCHRTERYQLSDKRILCKRAIRKVTSGELLTKQAMRKTVYYILKMLTHWRGVSSCMSVKEMCRFWAQPCFDTLHQLQIIVEALWSEPVVPVDKEVVVAWSKIRAVRRVANNSQLRFSNSAQVRGAVLLCGRALSWRSTTPDVSFPCLLFWIFVHGFIVFRTKYTSGVIMVPCCMNSTISTPFLSQKTDISFLACRLF
jgi:hypothetical protein